MDSCINEIKDLLQRISKGNTFDSMPNPTRAVQLWDFLTQNLPEIALKKFPGETPKCKTEWTSIDDCSLRGALLMYGNDPQQLSKLFPGKTDNEIRRRIALLKSQNWTQFDDDILRSLYDECQYDGSLYKLEGHPPNEITHRVIELIHHPPPWSKRDEEALIQEIQRNPPPEPTTRPKRNKDSHQSEASHKKKNNSNSQSDVSSIIIQNVPSIDTDGSSESDDERIVEKISFPINLANRDQSEFCPSIAKEQRRLLRSQLNQLSNEDIDYMLKNGIYPGNENFQVHLTQVITRKKKVKKTKPKFEAKDQELLIQEMLSSDGNWDVVKEKFPDFSESTLRSKWMNISMNPKDKELAKIKKKASKWNPTEDEILIDCLEATNEENLKFLFPTKSNLEIMYRINILKQKRKV